MSDLTEPTRLLMVDPAHYEVCYSINPWMEPGRWQQDPVGLHAQAVAASHALREALESAGAVVEMAPGAPGLPDMVFPANAGVVLDGRALVARFHHVERRGEEPHFLAIFESLRARGWLHEVGQLPEGCFQEGAGDCHWDATRGHFWAGFGPRSSRASIDALAAFFGQEVVPLELVSDRCYHLDVGFCVLSGGHILYLPDALTEAARRALRERVSDHWLIEGDEDDLRHFNLNAVSLVGPQGPTVVTTRCTPRLRAVLQGHGYQVVEVDLSPFMLSGGGAYCMTLNLSRHSRLPLAPPEHHAELPGPHGAA